VERPQERGRGNRGIRHGSGYNGRRGYGNGGLMGKSVPERKGTLNITVASERTPYQHAAVGTESRYAHSSEHPGKIADQKKADEPQQADRIMDRHKNEAGNRPRRLQKDNAKVESSRSAEIHRLVRVCLGLV